MGHPRRWLCRRVKLRPPGPVKGYITRKEPSNNNSKSYLVWAVRATAKIIQSLLPQRRLLLISKRCGGLKSDGDQIEWSIVLRLRE